MPSVRAPQLVLSQRFSDMDECGSHIGWDFDFRQLDRGRLDIGVTQLASPYLEAGCGIPLVLGGGSDPDLCPDGFLPGDLILDTGEQGQVGLRVEAFNEIIAEIAAEQGAALYDFASFLADANDNGVIIGGVEYTTEFVYGGLVSFDGFHPNPLT